MSRSEEVTYDKYPSTPHLQWSPEKHRDDSYHPDPTFFDGREVVLLEKMDGENLNIYSDGSWHARSIQTPYHPTREWAGRVAGEVGYKLPDGWRICAENLYGMHSIRYTDLRAYVQVYGIVNEDDKFLSWPDVVMWCEFLDLVHVPVLWRGELFFDNGNNPVLKPKNSKWEGTFLNNIGEDRVNERAGRESEGYVMRTVEGFPVPDFEYYVGKWVRENHVQTDEHWLETWEHEGQKNLLESDEEAERD